MAMSRKKVLWVDDEIEFLRSHIMFLETRGYSVTPVFNGNDALHILNEQPQGFDIVLLDEQMPGMDGLTVLQEIKDMLPDLPVVMVTKSEEEHVMEDALGKKIDGYLTKPVNPSQILLVCKRILDSHSIISSQTTQRFVRNHSEIKTVLQGQMDVRTWMQVYDNLVKWDIELEKVDDEGIRQAHAGQRSDANAGFAEFFMDNYIRWIKGQAGAPVFTPQIVDAYIVPRLKDDQKVCFVVFDCLRLDQYAAIEPLLRKIFNIERHLYFSNIPSAPSFAGRMLFGGEYAIDIDARHPGFWEQNLNDKNSRPCIEESLLREKLASRNLDMGDSLVYEAIDNAESGKSFLLKMTDLQEKQLIALGVNSVDLLMQNNQSSSLIQEMASDEISFRRLTYSWFQNSSLYLILKELAKEECTVILTSGNGSVLCTRGTEIYGEEVPGADERFRFGKNITSDERHALFMSEPVHFRLPEPAPGSAAIILKENYYFIQHDKFENYKKQYRNTFQNGGISMEEIIVPLAVMTPKQTNT
jgi:CheY-like chemotaxis protein